MPRFDENWRQRQAEAIRTWKPEQYRKTVTYAGGAPRRYGMEIRTKMRELAAVGYSGYKIAKELGVNRMLVYRELGLQPQTWGR